MDENTDRTALLTALTTEHFVQQTAIGVTINEMNSRTSVYMMTLSSVLVAMGFLIQGTEAFMPFAACVLPALVVLGIFTILRLVDVAAENMQAHIAIARIRRHYRTLGPAAAELFARRHGRWPESDGEPSLRIGPLVGYVTTAATMVASVNALVAGASMALLASGLGLLMALGAGAVVTALFFAAFYFYQRFRISDLAQTAAQYGGDERQ